MSQTEKEMIKEMEYDCKTHHIEWTTLNGVTHSAFNNIKEDDFSVNTHGVESIQAERENEYGDAKVSHQSIAVFWNEYLKRKGDFEVEIELDATDVAVMLSLMKVSRLAYKRKHDSLLDFASYADFALQFEEPK